MDAIVDSLNNAYQEFVAAATNVLEAKQNAGALETTEIDASLENFKRNWESFRVLCDQAEEFVKSMKQRIGSECLVDEATGHVTGQYTMIALPPFSAVRLEQMNKVVKSLVNELQHGSGTAAANSALSLASPSFDARFPKHATL